MADPTILQMQCFTALVEEGSFAAAAARLHRTHPTVHTAVKSLEQQLGLTLIDRSGYRTSLTSEGEAFYRRAQLFLNEYAELQREAAQLAAGEEAELRIVIGDLCPLPQALGLLTPFFSVHRATRLTLFSEAIRGPWERLAQGECDLILHHADLPSPQRESQPLFSVKLVPVAAPGFLSPADAARATPELLRRHTQCVIRDSSSQPDEANYYLVAGAHQCSVPDQSMKRELILQGLAWGHLPLHLIEADLAAGRLLSLENPQLQGATLAHFAIRRRDVVHGPVARTLWAHLARVREPTQVQ